VTEPSADATPSTDGADDARLASEQDSGSGPLLPLVAAGLLVVLLGAAGVFARRRRNT
jgi:LPXTG-motif cell wall-anchored protein